MAVKDPTLDRKIITAATEEFLEAGFQGASLRQIAKRANLSTGALYTRYKGKDDLFCSIIKDLLSEINHEFEPMRQTYMNAQKANDLDTILDAIRQEEKIYQQILLNHYDQCILFFCKSDGSTVQAQLEQFMTYKAKETVAYLNTISKKELNANAIEMLMFEQFYCYRTLLQKNLKKEDALSCLELVEHFHEAGWRRLLEQLLE